jgi:hypothetical protein
VQGWGDFNVDLHKPNADRVPVLEKPTRPVDSFFAGLGLLGQK